VSSPFNAWPSWANNCRGALLFLKIIAVLDLLAGVGTAIRWWSQWRDPGDEAFGMFALVAISFAALLFGLAAFIELFVSYATSRPSP